MLSVKSALEKLKSEIDAKRQKDLLASCQTALDSLQNQQELLGPDQQQQQQQQQQQPSEEIPDEEIIWIPFKQCCNPLLPPKLRETSIDLIGKLLATGRLTGSKAISYTPGQHDPPTQNANSKVSSPTTTQASEDNKQNASYTSILIDDIIHCVIMATPLSSFNEQQQSQNTPESGVHLQIIKCLLTATTSPSVEVHESTLLKALQACINIWLFTKNLVNQTTAKASLTQMIHFVFGQMEKSIEESKCEFVLNKKPFSINVPEARDENNPYLLNKSEEQYQLLLVRDAYFVLRMLCKFAMRSEKQQQQSSNDELSLVVQRTRQVSMEMILMILNNSGPALQSNETFQSLIRTNVSSAVSKNGLMTHPQLFELSLSIFLVLLKFYKSVMKAEIEVLFNEIYLYLLESQNSTFKQKSILLNAILKICENSQLMVDLYLNYDCDLNTASIYERLVQILVKLAQNQGQKIPALVNGQKSMVPVFGVEQEEVVTGAMEERKLRLRSIRCLHLIVQSLSDWLRENPNFPGQSLVIAANEMGIKQLDEVEKQIVIQQSSNSSSTSGVVSPLQSPPSLINNKNPLQSVQMMDKLKSQTQLSLGEESMEDLERMKTKKLLLKQGIQKFNQTPQKSIEFLREVGIIADESDESLLKFITSTPELSKSALGDFLGDGREMNVRLMHKFVDQFDFTKVEFVQALRQFLQCFRLPGEAQKIDRLMEKFSARYCECNKEVFAKADTAYTLAFSIMMLNTDLHSGKIKNKMTKQDFIKNNRGINDCADLPAEFLSRIYDDIQQHEICLEEERTIKALEKMTLVNNEQLLKKYEIRHLEKKSLNLIRKNKDKQMTPFKSATHVDHARPMFDLLWSGLLATCIQLFDECMCSSSVDLTHTKSFNSVNEEIITIVLHIIQLSTKISCHLQLSKERDAFIHALSTMTLLNDYLQISGKNISAIHLLILIAIECQNQLYSSWIYVLQVISDLDKLKSLQTTDKHDNFLSKHFGSQEFSVKIDKIFTQTRQLDGASIVDFFECLCKCAEHELSSGRTFSLQKVVEISYYNMDRIRLEWSQIWRILTQFFSNAPQLNETIATYCIDSLRQLGMRFLMRDELAHFNTNNEFLRPFEHLMRSLDSLELKQLILESLKQMISARAANIKSGWKSIFVILSRVVSTPNIDDVLVFDAHQILKQLQQPEFWDLILSGGYLIDYCSCLVDFSLLESQSFDPVIEECMEMLMNICKKLPQEFSVDDEFYLRWFPVLSGLARIQRDSEQPKVRSRSMDLCFDLLLIHGHLFSFSQGHWKTIIKSVLLPSFEDLKISPGDADQGNLVFVESVWIQGIRRLIEVYSKFYFKPDNPSECFQENLGLVEQMLDLILLLIKRNSQNLAHTGVVYFQEFIHLNAKDFNKQSWNLILQYVEQAFAATIPCELLRFPVLKKQQMTDVDAEQEAKLIQSINVPHAILKCATHLLMLEFIRDLALDKMDASHSLIFKNNNSGNSSELFQRFHILPFPSELFQHLPQEFQQRLLSCLHASFSFAHAFNENHDLRLALFKAGAVPQMPYLIKQETQALSTYLSIMFHLYRFTGDSISSSPASDNEDQSNQTGNNILTDNLSYRQYHSVLQCLIVECTSVLNNFHLYSADASKFSRELSSWSPVVALIFLELSIVPLGRQSGKYAQFCKHLPHFFRMAIKLISCDRQDVRHSIQTFCQHLEQIIDTDEFIKLLQ